MIRRKHIASPLTAEQLKARLRSPKAKIVMPKAAQGSHFGGDKKTAKFTFVKLGGVFSFPEEIGVDGNGKEHRFRGGTGFRFNWAAEGIGFGEFEMKECSDGTLEINAERMGKEFFKRALCALVDSAKDRDEQVN